MTNPIALTSGDPSGVGPEIALKAWNALRGANPFFLIGDPAHLTPMSKQLDLPITLINDPQKCSSAFQTGLPVLTHRFSARPTLGKAQPENAADIIAVIERAVALVQSGAASAICTNPIHKKTLKDGAGFEFPGHTEFLAHLGGVERSYMMLMAPELRVVPVTIHIALNEVASSLNPALITDTVRATHASLIRDFGIKSPRIALAGLNPHAGEGGAMGFEELDFINATVQSLQTEGMDIIGPKSADTMFHAEARAGYDVAICMYHDQALIPIKTLNFAMGVNATLGLPFIRTSPDHGTAFDIAGKGIADPRSLIEALKWAGIMAENRAKHDR